MTDVKTQLRTYVESTDPISAAEILSRPLDLEITSSQERHPMLVTVAAAAAALVLLGIPSLLWLLPKTQPAGGGPVSTSPVVVTSLPQDSAPTVTATDQPPTTSDLPATSIAEGVRGTPSQWTRVIGIFNGQITRDSEIWAVIHSGIQFVAAGRVNADCAQLWVSSDGDGWRGAPAAGGGVSIPCDATIYDLASDGSIALAVGEKRGTPAVWVSGDELEWEIQWGVPTLPFGEGDEIRTVAGSSLGFVAAGSAIWFSPDGTHWTGAAVPPVEGIVDVAAGPEGFVAVGSLPEPTPMFGGLVSTANAVLYSPDGRTWTVAATLTGTLGAEGECRVAANTTVHGPHGFLIAGDCVPEDATVAHSSMWTSEDGLGWEQVPYDDAAFGEPAYIASTAADDHGYLAAGWALTETGTIATVWSSDDGIAWIRIEIPDTDGAGIHAVMLHEGTGVAVGHSGSEPAIWLGTTP